MISVILIMLLVLVLSVIAHEIGHLIAMKIYLHKWAQIKVEGGRVRIGTLADYEALSSSQLRSVYLNGIYFGAVFIVACAILKPFFIILLVPYIMGCKKDIQNFLKVRKEAQAI